MFGLTLIDDFKTEIHRLWSLRIALFGFVLNGVALGLAAFFDVLNPWVFMGLNVLVYLVMGLTRLIKQAPTP